MKNPNVVFLSDLGNNPYRNLLIDNLKYQGFRVVDYFPTSIFLPKFWGKIKPEILHLHHIHFFFLGSNPFKRWIKFFIFVIQILILKLVNVKIVWTVHEWSDKYQGKWGEIYPFWSVSFGRLFDGFIVHCQTTKNAIIRDLRIENQRKVFVVPHGHYINAYKNDCDQAHARQLLAVPQEHVVFLLFGNIYRSKGTLEAIEAFKQLPKSTAFLLVAGFPVEDDIEEIIRHQIKGYDNILFTPKPIDDDDIQIYMNACDCFMVPYKVFTTSGVTLLGMSFGKACIAPRMGYFSDVLDESGAFLYDLEDKDGLLQVMKLAIERQAALAEMGKSNLEKAQQWSWEYVAAETAKVYRWCFKTSS
ncbi:glycosyltransferase family 4 protein [Cyanobacteria bacterium FACHB-63]|nr:glycosyltransferase family 4 protein [Cyanobacteria bacterium FACHB-63]